MAVGNDKRELKLLAYRAEVMPDLMKTKPGQWALIGFGPEGPDVLYTDKDFRIVREKAKEYNISVPFISYIPVTESSTP